MDVELLSQQPKIIAHLQQMLKSSLRVRPPALHELAVGQPSVARKESTFTIRTW